MPLQTGQNFQVALKRQSAKGVYPSGAGAFGFDALAQQGLTLAKAYIESKAARKDGQRKKGRHGTRKGSTSYSVEVGVGMCDDPIEAVQRGTWVAALSITQVTMTSITTTTTTIIAAAGDWRTQGVRRGDKVQLTGHSTAANNGKWYRVIGVTALIITLAPMVVNGVSTNPLVADAVADTSFTLTVAKSVISGTTPVERYYTAEEFGQDDLKGLIGHDMKLSKMEFDMQPDADIICAMSFTGLDVIGNESGTAIFTSPVYSTSGALVMADGTIRIGGTDLYNNILTGFKITIDLGGNVPSTLGLIAPDVFLNSSKVSGTMTALRQNLDLFNAYSNETPLEIFVDMVERGSTADPRPFLSLYVGDTSFTGGGGQIGQEGAYAESVPWGAGIDLGGSDRAQTTVKFATSAA